MVIPEDADGQVEIAVSGAGEVMIGPPETSEPAGAVQAADGTLVFEGRSDSLAVQPLEDSTVRFRCLWKKTQPRGTSMSLRGLNSNSLMTVQCWCPVALSRSV